MIERLHLSTLLLVGAIAWGVLLLLDGVAVSITWLGHLSAVVGILLLLLALFDLWVWKWRALHPWFVKRPILAGAWRAKLRSSWVDPDTQEQVRLIDGCMMISQTFSRVSLRFITEESQSELLGAEILRADDGSYRLFGVYRSEPKLSVRERSQIHYGGLVLQVPGTLPKRLEGHYWTDRQTQGELILSDHRSTRVENWEQATRLYEFTSNSGTTTFG